METVQLSERSSETAKLDLGKWTVSTIQLIANRKLLKLKEKG